MQQPVLSIVRDNRPVYVSPYCEEVPIESHTNLCASNTEPVDEEDGEW